MSSLQAQNESDTNPMDFLTLEMHIVKGKLLEVMNDAEFGSDCCLVEERHKMSILHIAAGAGQVDIISWILKQAPYLLYYENDKGDLPIHVALKAGQKDAVQRLVEEEKNFDDRNNKNQLKTANSEGNTALHIALDNQFDEIFAIKLFNECKQTFYERNNKGICPLYLAIKSRCFKLAKDILVVHQPESDHGKEVDALKNTRSVVHAAIMARSQEILKDLINKYPELIDSLYEDNWTILSSAARIGFVDGVEYLLKEHPKLACQHNEDGTYPFYQACSGGNLQVVQQFFTHFSTMKCSLNQQNQNILHIAAMNGKNDIVKYVLGQPHNKTEGLINMKDDEGNTPLHLASMGNHPKVVYTLTGDKRVQKHLQNKQGLTALDLVEISKYGTSFEKRLTWTALLYANVPRSEEVATRNTTAQSEEVATRNTTTRSEEVATRNTTTTSTEIFKERVNTLLVVCTLVATVTFAATFTMPGGYKSSKQHEGMATLAHRHAFQVFVISNTIAMYSSMFSAITLIWAQLDDINLSLKSFNYALPSLGLALIMMPVAFMTGSYVVLHTVCNWLAIVVLILGGGFLVGTLVFFLPLCSPTSHIKNKFMRYFFHIPFKLMLLGCSKSE